MTNYGKLFPDELTEWLIDAVLIQSKYKLPIYYKYAPYGTKVMHHMEQKLLFYLLLMIMYIGIILKLSENGLCML